MAKGVGPAGAAARSSRASSGWNVRGGIAASLRGKPAAQHRHDAAADHSRPPRGLLCAAPAGHRRSCTGDADLYVNYGVAPTTTIYHCRPCGSGNAETCTITAPQAGRWFVKLRACSAFSGVTLKGS